MVEKRTWGVWANAGIAMVGAMAIMLAAGLLSMLLLGRPARGAAPTPERILITTAAAAAAMTWTMIFMRRMFVRLDEFQQQGSRVAWYWGGTMGLAASLPLYTFIGLGGLHWLWPANFHLGADLYRAFQVGFIVPIVCEVVGFLLVGVWWRMSRR